MKFIILCYFLFFLIMPAYSYKEKDYQNIWCGVNNGEKEVVLPDMSRVDCVTQTHAVEFDFAKKWSESIGQSLYYSSVLGKSPAVVLIIENPEKDARYLRRLETVAKKYGITVWTMTSDYFEQNHLSEEAIESCSDFSTVSTW